MTGQYGACPQGARCCPCQDGDLCHYEGPNPSRCPTSGQQPCTDHRRTANGMTREQTADHGVAVRWLVEAIMGTREERRNG